MEIPGALSYVAEAFERLLQNGLTYLALAIVVLLFVGSFILGEDGARLRAGIARMVVVVGIGSLGAISVISVSGPPTPVADAGPPPENANQRIDKWIERVQLPPDSGPARTAPRPSVSTRRDMPGQLGDPDRPRDLTAARREFQRMRNEVERVPEAARTPEQYRRQAIALQGLALIDRDEGRIQEAIQRYRAAQAAYAHLTDANSKQAAASASLDLAEALDVRNDEQGARATYHNAINIQRRLVELPEPERREGIAVALVRYAKFETGRRQEKPARAALDEADDHYLFLRQQRGKVQVLRARAELDLVTGNIAAARRTLAAMRTLVKHPALTSSAPECDMVEARIELAEGNASEAAAMFAQAAAAYRSAGEESETRRALAAALLGRAEASYAARRVRVARESAVAAITVLRTNGDRAKLINGMVQMSLWEAASGDVPAARDALNLALATQRETGEAYPLPDTAATIRLLCVGLLRGSEPCRLFPGAGSTASRP